MKLQSLLYDEPNPFPGLFTSVELVDNAKDLKQDAALIVWGGEDIGTLLYQQRPNKYCHRAKPTGRDYLEYQIISQAIHLGMPIVGICRGAQMLCIISKGSLLQHINNHNKQHEVTIHDEGTVMLVNSYHHQMMMPPKDAIILASAKETTGVTEHNEHAIVDVVPEVVYFPNIRALGIQAHPEWADCPNHFYEYCKRKIKEYLLK